MYTYILRCMDNSLYCGYTTDIERREKEHRNSVGSKYVRAHKFRKMEVSIRLNTKSDAMKMECAIKKMSKATKEKIIAGDESYLKKTGIEYIEVNYH